MSLRKALCAVAAAWVCLAGGAPAFAAPAATSSAKLAAAAPPDPAALAPTDDALEVVRWVVRSGDNRGLPFAIVDKRAAQAYLFEARGGLIGATPVLLGSARGDASMPGVGELAPARIPAAARTTPAGRYASEPGRNLDGEDIVWFDYDAGLAIHRLRANAAQASRRQRLASTNAGAHRVSAGCIVVPVAFYEAAVQPLLGRGRGVLYVLPEERALDAVFAGLADD